MVGTIGHNSRVGPGLEQFGSAPDVVGVMVRLEHSAKPQLSLVEPVPYWSGMGWVNDHRIRSIHQDPDDVVLQDGQGVERRTHR